MKDDVLQAIPTESPVQEKEQKVVDIFTRHAVSSGALRNLPQESPAATISYRAYEIDKTLKRPATLLKFYFMGRNRMAVPYHHFSKMLATSDQDLSLLFAGDVFTLKGYKLDEIETGIERGKLVAIACFDPAKHALPSEDACIVTSIIHQTIREFVEG